MSTDSALRPVRAAGWPAGWPSPSTNSVDPPPMSTTRYGPPVAAACPPVTAACLPGAVACPPGAASSAVAPVNDRYASSWPLSTSGGTPSTPSTPRTKSAALAASRVALVATIRTASADVALMILA